MNELDHGDDQRWPDRIPSLSIPDRLPAQGGGPHLPAVDRNRSRGLDLTPEEVAIRRSNRRWMLILVVPSVVVLVLALVATDIYVNNQPSGPRIHPPAGYQALNDGYFSYAVPKTWKQNPSNTDQNGDVDTSGADGFAAEHSQLSRQPPVLGQSPPFAFQALGAPRPTPFTLSDGRAVTIPGASVAYRYTATRPGGFRTTVIDAYDYGAAVELWLMIDASPAVTDQIIASLRA